MCNKFSFMKELKMCLDDHAEGQWGSEKANSLKEPTIKRVVKL